MVGSRRDQHTGTRTWTRRQGKEYRRGAGERANSRKENDVEGESKTRRSSETDGKCKRLICKTRAGTMCRTVCGRDRHDQSRSVSNPGLGIRLRCAMRAREGEAGKQLAPPKSKPRRTICCHLQGPRHRRWLAVTGHGGAAGEKRAPLGLYRQEQHEPNAIPTANQRGRPGRASAPRCQRTSRSRPTPA